ncbi:MAG: hypothetical protein HQL68_05010 [Magnetococcales bacterium]|nr:hypothetical protein [Magnetococcales bacterium]
MLIFRETDIAQSIEYLTLSPFADAAMADLSIAAFLFTKVFLYSLPIWAHGLFAHFRLQGVIPSLPKAVWIYTPLASLLFFAILVMRSSFSPAFIYFQF